MTRPIGSRIAVETYALLYFEHQHWLDALQPPLEQHLERLAETVGLLLGIELNKRSVELMEVQSAPRGFSFDTRDSAKGELCGKEAYGTDAHNPFEADRLSLQITSGPQVRNVCLLARRKVHLGKHRHNDIVLRVLPPSMRTICCRISSVGTTRRSASEWYGDIGKT